eukprot:scaffold2611_cov114-Isochrysis_galbana.AAC.12
MGAPDAWRCGGRVSRCEEGSTAWGGGGGKIPPPPAGGDLDVRARRAVMALSSLLSRPSTKDEHA